MANREELAIIRGARSGVADSQLALGKLYLFGSTGLPKSPQTALHWLDRAARQGCAEAWRLIGNHIPLELAQQHPETLAWYEKAYDSGLVRAGLVYAQLTLANGQTRPTPAQRAKALHALGEAGRAGFAEAQWLLAREHWTPAHGPAGAAAPQAREGRPSAQRWPRRAADSDMAPAQFALLEQLWDKHDRAGYLERALPLARSLADTAAAQGRGCARLSPDEVALLSRCARLVEAGALAHDVAAHELRTFWELAAAEQDSHAQLALGLWCARMRVDGKRMPDNSGAANFKKAVRWLSLAGEQGLAEAWYALSRIYIKPEFSQRNVLEAQKYLERAAEMGYRDAQLECGNAAWRARRENEGNDVRALFWLQKAAAQGCAKAAAMLLKIAPRNPGAWKGLATQLEGRDLSEHPLLAARLELALAFGLSRAETLLLDVKSADRGHCLVVDIRASYGRSRRRLVLVDTMQERQLLDRVAAVFEEVDCGPGGLEGNYRQRLYRLRTLLPEADAAAADLDYVLAA
ncbi:tetratricopeptide repeat protein [Massilia sp. 9096]|uniref:tetratricopeptide repeat protein n=1 Tax=Massilia sp. 9096 TaxID=1500894 RepID=UPI0005633F5D|nr:SEL1-like repeat protein [Massilia sp. 9096]